MAAAALLLTFLAAGRSLTTASPQHRERPFEILAPQAAPLAHDQLGSSDDPLSPAPSALLPRRADQRSEIRGHQIPVTRTGLLPQRTAARRRALSGAGRCALCRCHQVASEDNPTPLLQDGAGGRPRGAAPSPREGTQFMTARITRSALANCAFLRREGHSGSHVTRRCWEMDSNLWFLRRMDTSTELIDDNLTLRHDLRSSVLVPGF
jgi:hypothetical protein